MVMDDGTKCKNVGSRKYFEVEQEVVSQIKCPGWGYYEN
jgi:hypothetical protein